MLSERIEQMDGVHRHELHCSQKKDDMIMGSYIYGWIGQKGRDDVAGVIWKEGEVWTSGKISMKKMKELYKPSDNYMKYRRKLSLLMQGTKTFKSFYSELKDLYKLCEMEEEQWCKEHESCHECKTETISDI